MRLSEAVAVAGGTWFRFCPTTQTDADLVSHSLLGKRFALCIHVHKVTMGGEHASIRCLELEQPQAALSAIQQAMDSADVRVWLPGSMHTMDKHDERINVVLDEQGVVVRLFRG